MQQGGVFVQPCTLGTASGEEPQLKECCTEGQDCQLPKGLAAISKVIPGSPEIVIVAYLEVIANQGAALTPYLVCWKR